jgi:hypothetical protein
VNEKWYQIYIFLVKLIPFSGGLKYESTADFGVNQAAKVGR